MTHFNGHNNTKWQYILSRWAGYTVIPGVPSWNWPNIKFRSTFHSIVNILSVKTWLSIFFGNHMHRHRHRWPLASSPLIPSFLGTANTIGFNLFCFIDGKRIWFMSDSMIDWWMVCVGVGPPRSMSCVVSWAQRGPSIRSLVYNMEIGIEKKDCGAILTILNEVTGILRHNCRRGRSLLRTSEWTRLPLGYWWNIGLKFSKIQLWKSSRKVCSRWRWSIEYLIANNLELREVKFGRRAIGK